MPLTILSSEEDQVQAILSGLMLKLENMPEEYRAQIQPDMLWLSQMMEAERDRLNAVLEALPLGVWITDSSGKIIQVNPQAKQMLGTNLPQPEKITDDTAFPCWRNNTGEQMSFQEMPVVRALRDEKPVHNVQVEVDRTDGSRITILSAAAPILDGVGRLIGAVGIAQDISTQKQVERELHESRAEIAGILESINDGFFAFDREWRYTFINHRAAEPLGYRPEDLIGRNLWEVFPKLRGTLAETHYRMAMEQGIPSQYRIQGVYSGRWYDISVYPSRDGISVFSIDRTEEVLAEHALRESEHRFRIALANSAIAVFSTDRELRYNWFYSSIMETLQPKLYGKRDDEIFPPEQVADLMEMKRRAFEQRMAVRGEVSVELESDIKNIVVSLEPYFDFSGEPAGVIGAYYDITGQRRLEAENIEHVTQREVQRRLLEYRERERQEIARDLHDGPVQDLSGLIFNVQYAKEATADAGAKLEFEQIAHGLKGVIHDLREMINMLRPPALIRFGLARALRFHLEDFGERHPEIELEAALMDDCDRLPEQVRLSLFRIVQEALINAGKHAQATRILVHLECRDHQAVLEVRDNGQGFASSSNLVGFTLKGHFGLVGMRERAEAIGGTLQVDSSPGQGTTVRAVIPLK